MVSELTWNKLNKLSKEELLKLFDLADIGLLNDPDELDKDDLILILSTESQSKVKEALKRL